MKKIIIVFIAILYLQNAYSQIVTKDTSAKKTVINFIKWYLNNKDSLDEKYPIVIISKGQPYKVDMNQANGYLFELKKSNMVSDYYLNEFKKYFVRCDSNFKEHPQTFDIPFGFDYDLVMKSNDYDNVKTNIDNSKIISYKKEGNVVQIVIEFNRFEVDSYELIKHKGKWLINKIKGVFALDINHKQPAWPPN